jgi:cytochrome c-type biogenesis protein
MQTPTLLAAFLFGLVSFLSPCVFPLIPAYIGYLSGPAVMAGRSGKKKPGAGQPGPGTANHMAAEGRPVARTAAAGASAPATTVRSVAAEAAMPMGAAGGAVVASPAVAPQAVTAPDVAARRPFSWRRFFRSPRVVVFLHALLFVTGFSFVFVVIIGGLAGQFSYFFRVNKEWVQYISGILLMAFGLHSIGLIRISFLDYTRRLDVRPSENLGYFRSFLIGLGFGAGWTPCIGGPLTAMFTMAAMGREGEAFPLFLAYSLGLGIPFLIVALAMGQVSKGLKKMTRRTFTFKLGNWTLIDQVNIISFVSGILLIIMGYLVFTNSLAILGSFAPLFEVPIE